LYGESNKKIKSYSKGRGAFPLTPPLDPTSEGKIEMTDSLRGALVYLFCFVLFQVLDKRSM